MCVCVCRQQQQQYGGGGGGGGGGHGWDRASQSQQSAYQQNAVRGQGGAGSSSYQQRYDQRRDGWHERRDDHRDDRRDNRGQHHQVDARDETAFKLLNLSSLLRERLERFTESFRK